MSARPVRRLRSHGITQLELMVSLVIMGMISVLLANALSFDRRALERSGLLSSMTDRRVSQRQLMGLIEAIPLVSPSASASDIFEGKAQRVQFKTRDVSNNDPTSSLLKPYEIRLSSQTDTPELYFGPASPEEANVSDDNTGILLAENIIYLRITYFGRISGETEPGWHAAWSDSTYLPLLVKLEWETGDGTPAPPLTLQPGKIERQSSMSLSSLVPPR